MAYRGAGNMDTVESVACSSAAIIPLSNTFDASHKAMKQYFYAFPDAAYVPL